jgi:hypothetical protein
MGGDLVLSDNIETVDGIYLEHKPSEGKRQVIIVGSENADYNAPSSGKIHIASYDFSVANDPAKSWEMSFEGYSSGTRIVDGKLILASRKHIDVKTLLNSDRAPVTEEEIDAAVETIDVNTLLPEVWINGVNDGFTTLNDCVVPNDTNTQSEFSPGLTTFTLIPLDNPAAGKSVCTLESSEDIFVSPSSLYVTKNDYLNELGDGTLIHKFAIGQSDIQYRASGRVPGNIGWRNRLFRMHEKDDIFRIVTTSYEQQQLNNDVEFFWAGGNQTHHLYLLKEDVDDPGSLTIVSQLPNAERPAAIGKPGEQIYGVRFFGDYGYVVTFKIIDPLYVINMSNASDPFIEGKLELPGYSDYLHPVNDNLLIGLGKDAIEENGTAWYQGLKLGVFDLSNKSNPKIIQEVVIGKRGTESIALREHHAFTYLADTENNRVRFAFPVQYHGGPTPSYGNIASASQYYPWQYSGLQLFELSTDPENIQLTEAGVIRNASRLSSVSWSPYSQNARSVFVNDNVFFTDGGDVWSANWSTPDNVASTDSITTVTGFLSYENVTNPALSNTQSYAYSVIDGNTGEQFYIGENPVIDNFWASNNLYNRVVTIDGRIVTIDGEEFRRLEATDIRFASPF